MFPPHRAPEVAMSPPTRRILVTNALPYVNGHLHLGHLVGYVQADAWVRFQRMRGADVRYFCADDTHGTATMIRADQEGRSPEALLQDMSEAHQRDFADFDVVFDHYGSTHAASNRALVEEFWTALRAGGHVEVRDVTQLFDPEAGIFLADRFVQGTCPRCDAPDQYGDNCEVCGAIYTPEELKDPRSTVSGARPESRTAPHAFVRLEHFQDFLEEFTSAEGRLQPEIRNWLAGTFLKEPLRDWDVSRPAPYFGFEIPDMEGHYFYVWVDAPVGYVSATADWCQANGAALDDWWRDPGCEIHHFIGKDIVYFHALFWPAMLKAAGFELPRSIKVHGFLTVNGEKMSKRKGTFVTARTWLDHLGPEPLRYVYASKLSHKVQDIDLDLEEFVAKVNSDLVGKLVNLASRSAKFVQGERLCAAYPEDGGLFADGAALADDLAAAYERGDTAHVTREVMRLADRANEYVEGKAPWKLRKEPGREEEVRAVCSVALNLFRQLVTYLAPITPQLSAEGRALLGEEGAPAWDDVRTPLVGTPVAPFKHLMKRVEPAQLEAIVAASQQAAEQGAAAAEGLPLAGEALAETCTIDEFSRVDLRVARIVAARPVKGADKLLEIEVALGGDERRTVLAGIKKAYDPETLVGRLTVVVANLAPRKMKFGTSEGMILAAGPGGSELFLLSPDDGAVPGQRIK
jgi:methionyl-tRNA synthetase